MSPPAPSRSPVESRRATPRRRQARISPRLRRQPDERKARADGHRSDVDYIPAQGISLAESLRQRVHVEVVPPGRDLVVHDLEYTGHGELDRLTALGPHHVGPL